MEFTIKVKVKRTDGPSVPEEEVLEALEERIQELDFEAGDEPSVFEVDDASLAG